ncbi:MAG: RNA polymerase sigma-70 factor [Candidatus Cyclonatronum sp.]|uniref:RNA polymerase sigma factor n=1 Tax=Cyclonatronum sp. TaxID=3024185 RepID=UPI0025C1A30D|nr:RNA polymerase sigma-70 factor [Cyclonatronum sp.]MCH8485355.1 RNA polymerase sigma-70 factor [Cyclonatronum sp.]
MFFDSSLNKALQCKDEQAFEKVFLLMFEPLCGFAFSITGARQVSECVVQDVFLSLWEGCGSINEETNLRAWLYRAVRNRCIDRLRAVEIRDRYVAELGLQMQEELMQAFTDSEEANEKEALIEKVNREIMRLPETIRETYLLHRRDGLTYAEIAEVLGLPQKTVESRMSKALKLLRERVIGTGRLEKK